jgi:hypothetical protein
MQHINCVARLGMALKASNVVGNPVTLHQIWWILIWQEELMIWFSVRQETAYVFGPRLVKRDPGLGIIP